MNVTVGNKLLIRTQLYIEIIEELLSNLSIENKEILSSICQNCLAEKIKT
jgi:hypothetical protein